MTPLFLLNFIVLQWFGVRLARVTCPNCERVHTRVFSYRCPNHRRIAIVLAWPLTRWRWR